MNFQNRKRLTDLENELKVAVGKRWGRRGVWDGHVHFAVFKMDNQQGPTVWHVELSSCHAAVWMGGASGENGYMYIPGRMDTCIYRGGWIYVYMCGWGFVVAQMVYTCNAGDPGSIPRLGRNSGEGNGYPFQHFAWRIP